MGWRLGISHRFDLLTAGRGAAGGVENGITPRRTRDTEAGRELSERLSTRIAIVVVGYPLSAASEPRIVSLVHFRKIRQTVHGQLFNIPLTGRR
jgi:hypothetical protein